MSFSRRDWMKASAVAPRLCRAPRPTTRSLATPYVGDRPPRVVTPNGSALTGRRADDGAWVYHLTAEEVEHAFAPGLTATCWGLQRAGPRPDLRGRRGRHGPHLRHQPAAGRDDGPLARLLPPQRDGRRRRAEPARDPAGRDLRLRVPDPPERDVHVPQPPRRDDADRPRADGPVRRPPARARRLRPRLRDHAPRVADRPRHEPPGPQRDVGLQRPHDEREGLPRHRPTRRRTQRQDAHPLRQPLADGPPPDPPPRALLEARRDRWRPDSLCRAVARDDGPRPGRHHADGRVHGRRPRRLGDALPHDAPRDEPDGPRVSEHGRRRRRPAQPRGAAARPPAT